MSSQKCLAALIAAHTQLAVAVAVAVAGGVRLIMSPLPYLRATSCFMQRLPPPKFGQDYYDIEQERQQHP